MSTNFFTAKNMEFTGQDCLFTATQKWRANKSSLILVKQMHRMLHRWFVTSLYSLSAITSILLYLPPYPAAYISYLDLCCTNLYIMINWILLCIVKVPLSFNWTFSFCNPSLKYYLNRVPLTDTYFQMSDIPLIFTQTFCLDHTLCISWRRSHSSPRTCSWV